MEGLQTVLRLLSVHINQPRVWNPWQCKIVLGNPRSWLLGVLKSALAPLQISTPSMALAHFDVPNTGTLAGHCCVITTAHWACLHAQHTLIGAHILNPNLPNKAFTCTAAMGIFKFNQHILNKPETYTTRGKSVITLVARDFVLVLFSQTLPWKEINTLLFSHYHVFFGSSTSHFDSNTCSPSRALQWKMRTWGTGK